MREFNTVEEANAYNVGFLQGVRTRDEKVDRPWFVGSELEMQAWRAGVTEGHAMRVTYFGEERRRAEFAAAAEASH